MKFCLIILLISLNVLNGMVPQKGYALGPAKEVSVEEAEDGNFIRHLFEDKFYDFAEEEAVLYLEKYPKGVFRSEVAYIRAQIDLAAERYRTALSKLDQMIQENPTSTYVEDAYYLKGIIYLQLGNDERSLRNFNTLLERFPKSKYQSKSTFYLGQVFFKRKEWKLAKENFNKVLDAGDLDAKKLLEARNFVAWSTYFQGDTEKSEVLFVELLESNIDADYKSKISYQMGIDTHKKKEYRKAIAWFEYLINKWSHSEFDDKARFWIAESIYWLYQQSPDDISSPEIERAVALFTRNLKLITPVNISISHYHRGWLYLALGINSKAERDFRWVQKNEPEFARDVELTIVRGKMFEKEKQWSTANDIYLTTLQLLEVTDKKYKLYIRIVRNEYHLGNCDAILAWKPKFDFKAGLSDADELHFYFGKCFYIKKGWSKAKGEFSKIPMDSQFGSFVFYEYIDTFRKTKDFEGGIRFLEQTGQIRDLTTESNILSLKIEFYSAAKRWQSTVDAMKSLMELEPKKQNDHRFLIRVAQTYDHLISTLNKAENKTQSSGASSKTDHERQSLKFYLYAYNKTPVKELDTRIFLLEILIGRYKDRKDFEKVSYFYQEAIKQIKNNDQRDELILQLALIQLNQLKRKDAAQRWLEQLHGKGNSESNYQASSLLAELHIDQNRIENAIKVLLDVSKQPIKDTTWYASIHFRLGELYQAREDWREALKHYSMVIDGKIDSPLKKQSRERSFEIKKYLSQSNAQE